MVEPNLEDLGFHSPIQAFPRILSGSMKAREAVFHDVTLGLFLLVVRTKQRSIQLKLLDEKYPRSRVLVLSYTVSCVLG